MSQPDFLDFSKNIVKNTRESNEDFFFDSLEVILEHKGRFCPIERKNQLRNFIFFMSCESRFRFVFFIG